MSTVKNPLAFVRDVTGKIIFLGEFESVAGLRVEDNLIVISIARARAKQARGTWHVRKRGTTLHTFHLIDGSWQHAEAVSVWWSTDELITPGEAVRDVEWEQMCYRPGNHRSPMDNAGRIRQGY